MKKFMVSLFIVALVLLIAGFVWGGYYIYFLLEDSPGSQPGDGFHGFAAVCSTRDVF